MDSLSLPPTERLSSRQPQIEDYHPRYIKVIINDNLVRTTEDKNFKPPLITIFGRDIDDSSNIEKIKEVWYPRDKYTYDDVKRIVWREKAFEDCPKCKLGREIEKKQLKLSDSQFKTFSLVSGTIGIIGGAITIGSLFVPVAKKWFNYFYNTDEVNNDELDYL